ncbi:MAG: MerR family transcriptional regulator [Chloroflexota bacterium]|nr:MerR family transcriptional regulator [Chloroflexota bacterium]
MLISELAARTGVTTHTIRYYEKEGVLDDAHTLRSENNYRHYTEEAVERVRMIKLGQAVGFTLAEMRTLLDLWYTDALTDAAKEGIVLDKIAEVERKMADLERIHANLRAKLSALRVGTPIEDVTVQMPARVR